MTYTPFHSPWQDFPDTTTPITAAALDYIEAGIINAGGAASYSDQEWFVHSDASPGGNGHTPGSAFTTFAEAIAAAADFDIINIMGELAEKIVVSKQVKVVGLGNHIVIRAPGSATTIDDIVVKVTANRVTLENLTIYGGVTDFMGILLAFDSCGQCRGVALNIQGGAGSTGHSYPTAPAGGTGVGGIGLLLHNGEGHYFENLLISECAIGLGGGVEASTNVFNRVVFSSNSQDVVMGLYTGTYPAALQAGPFAYQDGTPSLTAGGWSISYCKSTNPQNNPSNPVFDQGSINGLCTFVACDWTEGGTNPTIRIAGDGNLFLRPSCSPEAQWLIDGNDNTFIRSRMLNSFRVNGDRNTFEGALNVFGTFYGSGSHNTFRRVNFMDTSGQHLVLTGVSNMFDECTYTGAFGGGTNPTLASLGTSPKIVENGGVVLLDWNNPTVTDVNLGAIFYVGPTSNANWTFANPIDTSSLADSSIVMHNGRITYDIENLSGGALGTITWDTAFLLAGAFTSPANGKRRTISFYYDGANWVEINRAAADI